MPCAKPASFNTMRTTYEQLVSLATAKLAADKGFDGHCRAGYYVFDNRPELPEGVPSWGQTEPKLFVEDSDQDGGPINYALSINSLAYLYCQVPTQDAVETWLRQRYQAGMSLQYIKQRYYLVTFPGDGELQFIKGTHPSYEQARELGLTQLLNCLQLRLCNLQEYYTFSGRREALAFLAKRTGKAVYPSVVLEQAIEKKTEVEGLFADYFFS